MDFRLTVFATAARTLNFSHTAELLGISQPSVSTHIKLLEKELGVQLFARRGKGFVLTYSGELILQKAERILALYKEMEQEASLLSNITEGTFTVGIPRAIYYGFFPDFAADWCRLSPGSTILHKINDQDYTEGDMPNAIIKVAKDKDKDSIFFTDVLLAVTPSEIKEDNYYDIAETKLLRYDGDPETSSDVASIFSASDINPQTLNIAATMKDPVSAIKFLVEYGKGSASATSPLVAFLWKSQIGELLRKGILKTIMLTETAEIPPVRRTYAIYETGKLPEMKKETNPDSPYDLLAAEKVGSFIAFAKGWAKKKLLL